MTTEGAIAILKSTSYFYDASETFVQELATKLVPIEAEDGHVFIEEGEPMTTILILEEGTLQRTKLSVQKEDFTSLKRSLKQLKTSLVVDPENIVVVDEFSERGRITGLLHTVGQEGSVSFAYATVSAKGKSKVWQLAAEDFRATIQAKPEYVFDILQALAREVRTGSKSLQRLLASAASATGGKDGDDPDAKKRVKILCYDTTSWVKDGFDPAIEAFNKSSTDTIISFEYTPERLSEKSATYAAGYDGVCLFVNDNANEKVLHTLSLLNVKLIAMRCAGFDRVDTRAALAYGVTVVRVPAYSPYAVAEFAVTLLLSLNRKLNKASARVKMANFTLDAGLLGMDIHGKTIGIMGTGNIGQILVKIMAGFGANIICYDVYENKDVIAIGAKYVTQDEIFTTSDIIFLMMPLFPSTKHTINEDVVQNKLKRGVYIINTSRGGLIDTVAVLKGLQSGIIDGLGIDVYENEAEYFFQDWSAKNITDTNLIALLGETNVIMSAHQAFFTKEAVTKIVDTTVSNIQLYHQGQTGINHPNNCLPKVTIPK